jgi:G3E family GTPase
MHKKRQRDLRKENNTAQITSTKVQSFDKALDTPKKVQNHCQHEQTKERQSSHLSHHKTHLHHKEMSFMESTITGEPKEKRMQPLASRGAKSRVQS